MENRIAELRVNKNTIEYHEGIREGRRQERGFWIQVLDSTSEIDEKLIDKIIGEVAEMYEVNS